MAQSDSPHLVAKTSPAEFYFGCAETDPYIPMEMVQQMMRELEGAHGEVELYAGVEHGFAANGRAAQLSQSELDALRARLSQCWSPPPGVDVSSDLFVVLHVLFKPDGSLAAEPAVVEGSTSALGPALADSTKRALTSGKTLKSNSTRMNCSVVDGRTQGLAIQGLANSRS